MICVEFTCAFFIFYLIDKDVEGVHVLRRMENATSWPNAQSECVSSGGNLLLIDSYSIQSLDRCGMIQDEAIWEGKYNTFSEWVIHTGCFQLINNDVENPITMTTPGSVECGELCQTSYFAVQNSVCFCMKNIMPNSLSADDMCGYKCNLRGEPCGGNGTVSVYSKVSSRDVRPREDDLQPFLITCGLAECTPPDWRLFGYPCDRSLKAFCSDGSILSQNTDWRAAQNNCWNSKNSSLHGYELMSSVECMGTSSLKNLPLWIQMRRDKVTRVVEGRAVNPESTCYGGRINNGTFMSNEMDCSHKHTYICIMDIGIPTCEDCLYNRSVAPIPCPTQTKVTPHKRQEVEKHTKKPETIAAIVGSIVAAVLVLGIICICLKRRSALRESKQPRDINNAESSERASRKQVHEDVTYDTSFEAKNQNRNNISNESTLLVRHTALPNRQTEYRTQVKHNEPNLKIESNEKIDDEIHDVKENKPGEKPVLRGAERIDNKQTIQNTYGNIKSNNEDVEQSEGQTSTVSVKSDQCTDVKPVDMESSKPMTNNEIGRIPTTNYSSKQKHVSVINVCAHPSEDKSTKL